MKVLSVASLTVALAWTAVAAAADDFTYSPYYPMQVGATWNYKTGDSKFSVKVTTHEKIGTTSAPAWRRCRTARSSAPRTCSPRTTACTAWPWTAR